MYIHYNKNKTVINNVLDDNHRQIQWFIKLRFVVGGDCASTSRYAQLFEQTMETDIIGNALRKYYGLFGVDNEGLPAGVNVSKLLGNPNFEFELQLIEKICKDEIVVRKHKECNDLVEKIANSLNEATFMNEINDSISEVKDNEREHFTNGIFWHYLASVLDPKLEKQLNYEIPFPGELSLNNRDLLKTQGSLIFRLYISLVYMKEGPLLKLLKETSKNKKPISQLALKLIRCDYVRHLRNAISHSTFESTSFGILFKDEDKFEAVATPEFLNKLGTWIFLINFQCSSVIDKK